VATGDRVTKLDALIDCRGIMDELGVKRASAESLMRDIPTKFRIGRKVFVKREDVRLELEKRAAA
jgi:hypothetical protein